MDFPLNSPVIILRQDRIRIVTEHKVFDLDLTAEKVYEFIRVESAPKLEGK